MSGYRLRQGQTIYMYIIADAEAFNRQDQAYEAVPTTDKA